MLNLIFSKIANVVYEKATHLDSMIALVSGEIENNGHGNLCLETVVCSFSVFYFAKELERFAKI